jgi:hypothetical protein
MRGTIKVTDRYDLTGNKAKNTHFYLQVNAAIFSHFMNCDSDRCCQGCDLLNFIWLFH